MLLRWLKNWKRRTFLSQPFPPAWLEILDRNVLGYAALNEDQQARVRDYLLVFLPEKNWEGCGGQAMNHEVQVTIAAQVAILTLGLEDEYFENVLSILVYPTAYVAPGKEITRGGVVLEEGPARLGEAWYRGPVIFSWQDVLSGGRQTQAGNVVYHEFAHQLDMLNGQRVDGAPPIEDAAQAERWAKVCAEHYQQLVQACELDQPTLIDCYGATNEAEFFAVTTETFFTQPRRLATLHPALYEILRDYYRQDPAARTK